MSVSDERRGWIDDMRADLGAPAVLALQKNSGGQRRYIPSDPARSWIVAAAGAAVAHWLSERFGGESLEIPLAETLREKQARELYEAIAARPEMTANALARHLGVHTRTIRAMRSRLHGHNQAKSQGSSASGGPEAGRRPRAPEEALRREGGAGGAAP